MAPAFVNNANVILFSCQLQVVFPAQDTAASKSVTYIVSKLPGNKIILPRDQQFYTCYYTSEILPLHPRMPSQGVK